MVTRMVMLRWRNDAVEPRYSGVSRGEYSEYSHAAAAVTGRKADAPAGAASTNRRSTSAAAKILPSPLQEIANFRK